MQKNTHPRGVIWAVFAAVIVICDEWLKSIALHRLPAEGSISNPGIIELAIHKNWGIAFDIPFKLPFIILISLAIGAFLLHVVWKTRRTNPNIAASACIILIGAAGNLFDRLVYGFTVDYIILFGRSAINLSDIVILAGVVSLLLASRKAKKQNQGGWGTH